jgi:hypothetical protein
MRDISKLVEVINTLLSELDDDEFEFNAGVNAGTIRDSGGPTGSDKFEARRKVKKLNRRLDELDDALGDDTDVRDVLSDEPHIKVTEREYGAVVSVDEADADIRWEMGDPEVTVSHGSGETVKNVGFPVSSVERNDAIGMTTFEIHES